MSFFVLTFLSLSLSLSQDDDEQDRGEENINVRQHSLHNCLCLHMMYTCILSLFVFIFPPYF